MCCSCVVVRRRSRGCGRSRVASSAPPRRWTRRRSGSWPRRPGVDAASLLTQFGAYGDPERDPRMNVVTIAYLAVLRDVGAVVAGTDAADAALVPVSDVLERSDRPGVRSSADRARCDRACPRRARGHGRRDGVRRSDVHPGRAAGGVRGRLGRAARRRELPAEHRRGGRLGDPDRAPGPARARPAAGPRSSIGQGGRGATADPIHRLPRNR